MKSGDLVNCPYCGASIKKNATACPECGSDEMTGWSEFSYMDGITTVDEEEYDELYENEFSQKKSLLSVKHIVIGILLLAVFLFLFILRYF